MTVDTVALQSLLTRANNDHEYYGDQTPFSNELLRNMAEALSRHDWLYRWESVLKLAGLQPRSKLLERKQRLADLLQILRVDQVQSDVLVG